MSDKAIEQDRTRFAPEDLRSLTTLEDVKRLLIDSGVGIEDAAEVIGDGFHVIEDKAALVNVPMVLIQWVFAPGDFGEEFVVARAMTQRGDKVIVTDGGTGVCAQLRDYEARTGRTGGLVVDRGLRVSEYNTDENGQPLPDSADPSLVKGRGRTFYLNV